MANNKSAKKRNRQMIARTARNRSIKSRVKNARKAALAAILTGDKAVIAAKVAIYASTADKAANKNVIHKNAASRFKARIAAALEKASAAPAVEAPAEKPVKAPKVVKTAKAAKPAKAAKA